MNVDTGSFRALSDQAARVDEYHRREGLLIRTLAAELSGGGGPLTSDVVVVYLADAVVEQGRWIADMRASLGITRPEPGPRHLRAVK